MVNLSLGWKIGVFLVILAIAYLALRYYDMDPFMAIWESISEIEWNPTALILNLVFSTLIWLIIWKNPFWAKSTFFGLGYKIFLTVALPIVGYPLAVRALNKE